MIEVKMSDVEIEAHKTLQELLWVLYPRPDTVGPDVSLDPKEASGQDLESEGCARLLIDGLHMRNFEIVRKAT